MRGDGSRYNDYDLARPLERVDVVFGQCRVGFSVDVEHHPELVATSIRNLIAGFGTGFESPDPVVVDLSLDGRVNVFVAGAFEGGVAGATYGRAWPSRRIVATALQAVELTEMVGDSQRLLAHEVGHTLGLGDHFASGAPMLMDTGGYGPTGGVQLSDTDCGVVRPPASSIVDSSPPSPPPRG